MKNAVGFAVLLVLIAASAAADIVRVELDDMIHPISDEYVGRALDDAALRKADAVIIELRTPGGLETSMRGIVEKIIKSPRAGHRLGRPERLARGVGRLLHPRIRGRRGDGARHEHRRRASGHHRRREARRHHEDEDAERRRGVHAQHRAAARTQRRRRRERRARGEVVHRGRGARAEADRSRGRGRPVAAPLGRRQNGQALQRHDRPCCASRTSRS